MSESEGQKLVNIGPAQQAREFRRAQETEIMQQQWRRTWRRVFAQCVILALAGYSLYGVSWTLRSGTQSELVVAVSFAIAYVLPFFRLVFFFVKHSDQF